MSETNLPAIFPARETAMHNRNTVKNVAVSFILICFAQNNSTEIATNYSMTHCDTVLYWPLIAGY